MKLMVIVITSILLIALVTLFWPSGQEMIPASSESVGSETEEKAVLPTLNPVKSEDKVALMTAEYEMLEKKRSLLKRRLARLKHEMWGLEFAPGEAKDMSDILYSAHKLIKNPNKLGAFHDTKDIQNEIAKIRFVDKSLNTIDEAIKSLQQKSE